MTDIQPNPTTQLAAAFDLFNQMSDALGDSYRELELRVSELSQQLADERTEKFRELAAKEKLADRLSTLLRILPAGVVVVDKDHMVRETNPSAAQLLGRELIGQSWPNLLQEIGISQDGFEIRLHSGRYIALSDPVHDFDGSQVVLLTDVTEAHELQEVMNRESRLVALGEMAARLAHQLRTPLSSALLYASHLSMPNLDDSDRTRLRGKIAERLHHLDELVGSMLKFVRGSRQSFGDFLLADFIQDLEGLAQSAIQNCGGTVVVDNHLDIPLRGDKDGLLSAMTNIIENAVSQSEKPELRIQTQVVGSSVSISIKDNGPGIDPDVIDKIFDPFFTTRVEGTGLGLAIADATAREHDGSLSASNCEHGGAEFRLTIPSFRAGADRNE